MFSKQYNTIFHESKSFKRVMIFPNVVVTPELAQELIRLNDNNRPVRTGVVERYSEDMKAGDWRFSGDNIRISNAAKLLDGQHRLLAIIKSKKAQTFNIQTGLEPEAFEVIDTGRGRSAADAVSVKGIQNATTVAGAAKIIKMFEEGHLTGGNTHAKRAYRNADIVNFLETEANMPLLIEMATAGNKWSYASKFLSPATYAAFGYLFGIKNREEAILFFDLLSTGENIGKSNYSMIYLLRKKFIDIATSNMEMEVVAKYALIIKAWNAYIKGKEIGQLSWSDKEAFPVIAK